MKTKTIKNKCGGKSSGCCAYITLPYGIAPERTADNSVIQVQSSK